MNNLSMASKSKSFKSKKVSPELIEYFKNTAELPQKNYKENQFPKQSTINTHCEENLKGEALRERSDKVVKSKVVECDISSIADSYILEGNHLRKHEPYEETIKKQMIKQSQMKKSDKNKEKDSQLVNRKQIIKLEYLQKMGFLRPDEKQILAQYRKLYPQKTITSPTHRQVKNQGMFTSPRNNVPYCPGSQQYDSNVLPHYFSPNAKGNYQSHFVY